MRINELELKITVINELNVIEVLPRLLPPPSFATGIYIIVCQLVQLI